MKKFIAIFLMCFIFPLCADAYYRVDNHARRVPRKYDTSLESVVRYLVGPYQNDEDKKARALFAWIVYHIDYDGYNYRVSKEHYYNNVSPERSGVALTDDIFISRLGSNRDIAELYQKMADLAGLENEVVSGYADDEKVPEKNEEIYGHEWNVVKINGQWEFVDATWGMTGRFEMLGDIDSDKDFRREIEKRKHRKLKTFDTRHNRQIDNDWFKTDPLEMQKTHRPNDVKWWLLDEHFRCPRCADKKER